ncbi:MAG: YncE family protein [Tepidisphaerales bacterium]
MKSLKTRSKLALAAVLAAVGWGGAAKAMSLTPAGTTLGFTLTTFADQFPVASGVGPLGVAFVPGGTVLVSDYPGTVRVFPNDSNGQHAPAAPVAQNYGGGNAIDLVQAGGSIYMTQQAGGNLVQINNDGTFNQLIASGMPAATGAVTDPVNGHVFVSTLGNNVIWDVDPIAKSKALFVNAAADGLSISPDGKTVYAEVGGHILGYDTGTKLQTFDSGAVPGGPDGAAVGFGTLAGNIFVNTNGGTVYEVNLSTSAQTLIATGGTRGDFVTVDPSDGSLLLTQTDQILRLTPAAGGSFNGTPLPAAAWSGMALMLAMVGFRWMARPRTA